MVKKRVKKKSVKRVRSSGRKIKLVFRRFIFFAILFVASLLLRNVAGKSYQEILLFLALIFGFVGIALLMALIILGVMRILKK